MYKMFEVEDLYKMLFFCVRLMRINSMSSVEKLELNLLHFINYGQTCKVVYVLVMKLVV